LQSLKPCAPNWITKAFPHGEESFPVLSNKLISCGERDPEADGASMQCSMPQPMQSPPVSTEKPESPQPLKAPDFK